MRYSAIKYLVGILNLLGGTAFIGALVLWALISQTHQHPEYIPWFGAGIGACVLIGFLSFLAAQFVDLLVDIAEDTHATRLLLDEFGKVLINSHMKALARTNDTIADNTQRTADAVEVLAATVKRQ